jgi:hypothetical protein
MPYKYNSFTGGFSYYEQFAGTELVSQPSQNNYYVTNIYVNQAGKLEIEYDDAPMGTTGDRIMVQSNPPSDGHKVENMYVEASTGKLTVKYNEE